MEAPRHMRRVFLLSWRQNDKGDQGVAVDATNSLFKPAKSSMHSGMFKIIKMVNRGVDLAWPILVGHGGGRITKLRALTAVDGNDDSEQLVISLGRRQLLSLFINGFLVVFFFHISGSCRTKDLDLTSCMS